jgi:hypothetical protein
MELASYATNSNIFRDDGRIRISSVNDLFNRNTVKKGKYKSIEDGRLDVEPTDLPETVRSIVERQQSTVQAFYYPDGQRDPTVGWTKKDAENYIITLAQYKQTHNPWIINAIKDPKTRLYKYFIIDAGHRFYNLILFLEDGFLVAGRYWSQWDAAEKQNFFDVRIRCIVYNNLSEENACEIMRLMNTQLKMDTGERYNISKIKKDKWIKFCSGLFLSSTEDLLHTRLQKGNGRFYELDVLTNLGKKYMDMTLQKPVKCGSKFVDNLPVLSDFFLGDDVEKKQRQAQLIDNTIKVLSLFPPEDRREKTIQRFDFFMVFMLFFKGEITDNKVTKNFFEAVYNTNIADGLWYKKWRDPELNSGHGKEADKIKMKTKIYRDFCTQFIKN